MSGGKRRFQVNSYTVGFRQSKTASFDWTFFRLHSSGSSYRQPSRFCSFCAFPRGDWCEGVLLYGSRKLVGSSALRAFFASNACFALDGPSSKRVGGVELNRTPPKLRSWRCTQPRAAKATFVALHSAESSQSYVRGVALSREQPNYSRRSCCRQNGINIARCCCRVIHSAGKRS